MFITPEELLVGKEATYDVTIPTNILYPLLGETDTETRAEKQVRLRPLTIHDVQLIAKAAKNDEVLTSVLMIQRAVIEPSLKQNEISAMHSGLIRFLVDSINRISGLSTSDDDMQSITESPLVRAFFVLAKEFNWTPQQVREMTVGQILGYLELLNQSKRL